MLRVLTIALIAFGLIFAAGCKKKEEDACTKLTKKICDGKSGDWCKKAKDVLDKDIFTGPDGKALDKTEKAAACALILSDEKIVGTWVENARKKVDKPAKPEPPADMK
jgi:hypothetical protein